MSVFEKGLIDCQDQQSSTAKYLDRPALHAKLIELLRPPCTSNYQLVVGAHGTGKSTAVRKAAKECPGSETTNGVVYVTVGTSPSGFYWHLCNALGFYPFVYGLMGVAMSLVGAALGEKTPLPDATSARDASWTSLSTMLMNVADKFRQKHGRPMTLVIDDVQRLLQDPPMLDRLQDFAKDCADRGLMRVVFVSSDIVVHHHMSRRSAWSRCGMPPVEVGESDISDASAVDLLCKRFQWTSDDQRAVAAYLVAQVTGGRLGEIHSMNRDFGTLPVAREYVARRHEAVEADLFDLKLQAGHTLFTSILEARDQRLSRMQLMLLGVSSQLCSQLVERNILAWHPGDTYSCANRAVECVFRRYVTARSNSLGA